MVKVIFRNNVTGQIINKCTVDETKLLTGDLVAQFAVETDTNTSTNFFVTSNSMLGRDIGFLPGDVEDKLGPWMQPIYDNVEFLLNLTRKDKRQGRSYRELIDMDLIEIEPLTYIRGRSIPHQFLIVDEAQNLTPHEVKTVATRVGEGTKIVFTGDATQIDNPYLDSASNGLSYAVEQMRGLPLFGHVTLVTSERSALARIASERL